MKENRMFLYTACITPFDQDGSNIDYESLQHLLTAQTEAGNGVILLGSTGENLSLTEHEKHALIEFVCSLNLNTKIIVGVPGINLWNSLEWISFCNNMPIHGYLMTTPIYTKPGIIGQTLWFEKLLKQSNVPVMLYNIPSRAGINLHTQTVGNLSQHENFWAIKDSSGNINTLIEYHMVASNIKIFCGDDHMILDMINAGAQGLVSVASNIWPSIAHKYVKYCLSKKNTQVNTWSNGCKALFSASNPIPVKALLHDTGMIKNKTVRLPLSDKDLPCIETLRQAHRTILNLEPTLLNN